jgi:protein TonB
MGTGGGGEDFTPAGSGPTLEYEAGRMTPPRQISGPDPEYTLQALQNDVQGLMVVKCIVTVEGAVHGCRVVQGLPFMDRAVMEALERRRYVPARLPDGRPVDVDYTFRIRLQLPQ